MKTERINIYIHDKTKKKLNKYCKTHHVSYSTCAYYLTICYQSVIDNLKNDYVKPFQELWQKTSIKPKNTLEKYTKEERAKIYSNLIYIYFEKQTKNYISEEKDNKIRDTFNKYIQQEQDIYANYNEYIRNTTRALKNKNVRNYFKKAIERQEQKHD